MSTQSPAEAQQVRPRDSSASRPDFGPAFTDWSRSIAYELSYGELVSRQPEPVDIDESLELRTLAL